MKKYLLLFLLCFAISNTLISQSNHELKLKQYSLEPDFENQTHLLSLENKSNSDSSFIIITENIKCEDSRTKNYTDLEQVLLKNNSTQKLEDKLTLKPKEIFEFKITIKKPTKAKLGSINCTKVIAKAFGVKPKEEFVIIKSYVPDPNNAN